MPGWDYHSCGFHGDDGFRFHGSGGNGNTFAEARGFEPGSVVGCGVLFDSHKVFHHHTNNSGGSAVFYTVDAQLVGPLPLTPTPTPTLALALALTLTLALALTLTLTRWMVSSSALPSWCRISSAGDGLLRPCLLWPYYLRKVVKVTMVYAYPRATQTAAMVVAVAHGLPLVPPKRS